MENASKALVIAGGILIAMAILTIGVYLRNNLGKTTEAYAQKLDTVELQKYNSKFETYIDRKDITAQEIVTIASNARQLQTVKVSVGRDEVAINGNDREFENWKTKFLNDNILTHIKDNTGKEVAKNTYSCVSIAYETDGRVREIKFEKN